MSYADFPAKEKSLEGVLRDLYERVDQQARRRGGAGGGSITYLEEGTGIDITGDGSSTTPYLIGLDGSALLPALPDPVASASANPTVAISTAAGTWGNVAGWNAVTITPERDLWVRVPFNAQVVPSTSGGYIAVGISITGGVNVPLPSTDPLTNLLNQWGQSPFGYLGSIAGSSTPVMGEKVLMLPGGVATTFTPQALRQNATGSTAVNYGLFRVIPLYWDAVALPVRPVQIGLTRRYVAASTTGAVADSVIPWTVLDKDSGHFTYDTATNEFVCVQPGQYVINTSIGMGAIGTTGGDYVVLTTMLNGVIYAETLGRRDTLGGNTAGASCRIQLVAGDRIKSLVRTGLAGGSVAVANNPRTFIELVPILTTNSEVPLDAVRGQTAGMKVATGRVTMPSSLAVNASVTIAIVFPVGFFANPPVVTFTPTNSRVSTAISQTGHTKDGCNLSVSNWSDATMPATQYVDWVAIGT